MQVCRVSLLRLGILLPLASFSLSSTMRVGARTKGSGDMRITYCPDRASIVIRAIVVVNLEDSEGSSP